MKIIHFLAVLLTLFSASFSLQGDTAGIEAIGKRGELVVAMLSFDVPPFIMKGRNGAPTGYDVDIATGIADALGVKLKIDRSAKTFNDLVDMVETGKADIAVSNLSRTLPRAKKVLFTEPYITMRQALLMNRVQLALARGERNVPDFIRDFRGKLGVLRGSAYEDSAKTLFPKAELIAYDNWRQIVSDVDKGNLLGAFYDELEVRTGMKATPAGALKMQCVIFKDSEDPIAIAVAADKPMLRDWLNLFLHERNFKTNVDELIKLQLEENAATTRAK